MKTKLLLIILLTTSYTIARYVIFGPVSIFEILFLLNKTIAIATVIFLAFFSWAKLNGNEESHKSWCKATQVTALIHIIITFCLLSAKYYPKFFSDYKLNTVGNLVILSGLFAVVIFFKILKSLKEEKQRNHFITFSYLLILSHLAIMGFNGWLNVAQWHGNLPPISLISFVFGFAGLIFHIRHVINLSQLTAKFNDWKILISAIPESSSITEKRA